MVFILCLLIIIILIVARPPEQEKVTTEDWMEGLRVILILVGVVGVGLALVWYLENYYF